MQDCLPIHIDGNIMFQSIKLNLASYTKLLFRLGIRLRLGHYSNCTHVTLAVYFLKFSIFLL